MFKRIAHICIGSHDLNATQRFYCDALGMKRQFDFIRKGEIFGFYLGVGDMTFIEVFKGEDTRQPGHVLRHICLETDDIDAVIARLESMQIKLDKPKSMGADNTWQCWVTSSEGVAIEIQQYTDKSSQVTGQACHVDW